MWALSAAHGAYNGNMALSFTATNRDVVRLPHESSMNEPLIDSWTVELWVKATKAQQKPASGRHEQHVNLVSFVGRHPRLSLSPDGHARTSLKTVNGSWYSYEGSTPLNDGQWHHVAATWDGTSDELSERELYLYVDGHLEHPGPGDADQLDGPKTPEAMGVEVVRECVGELCEEGMQLGGLYCCGGKGYSGGHFNGTIDEIRVWTRALSASEIVARKGTPLYAGDFAGSGAEQGLLLYLPLDDAGMEMGANVVEAKGLHWYGMLGTATGRGRPRWTVSDAPLTCGYNSRAPACAAGGAFGSVGGGGGFGSFGSPYALALVGGEEPRYTLASIVVMVVAAAALAGVATVLATYASITGQLPPAVVAAGGGCAKVLDFLPGVGYARAPTSEVGAGAERVGDWTWSNPPREAVARAPATPATSYGAC